MKKVLAGIVTALIALSSVTAAYAAEDTTVKNTEPATEAVETTDAETPSSQEINDSNPSTSGIRLSKDGNFKIKVNDTDSEEAYVDIVKYVGKDKFPKNYTIDEIDGLKVRNIRSKAFNKLKTLKHVTFIGSYFGDQGTSKVKNKGFNKCTNMKSFTCNSLVKLNDKSVGYSDGKKNETFTDIKFDDDTLSKYDVSEKIAYAEEADVNAVYNVNKNTGDTEKACLKEAVNGSEFDTTVDGKKVEGWESSDSDVISISDNGTATVLKKGTATLSVKVGKKTVSREFKVEKNPEITRNGKKVKSVTVKNGKTVKLNIKGKADSVANVYTNTSNAQVVSDENSDTIKIKGVKAGNSTLKIKVNGKTFKIKVKVKKNPITYDQMRKIVDKIGWQTWYSYSDSTIMCSAYSFAYAYAQVTGNVRSAGSFWSPGGCTWIGGTYTHYGSSASMLKAIKASLDKNQACVGLLAYGSSATHYVTFYDYEGKGDKLSDFKIIDPWDGTLTPGYIFRYCGSGYHVITIDT